MIFKERFKPTKWRVILAFLFTGVLFTIFSLVLSEIYFDAPSPTGWPFSFKVEGAYRCMIENNIQICFVNDFFWSMFVTDLIIFLIPSYIISCLIIRKVNKKYFVKS